ncbi:hypothetical protein OIV83_001717 [Microbotryomycetes sp. JL201]|nr:hypothetical protein OIV83_001717 [Microbotryomycetes sp. JL201]
MATSAKPSDIFQASLPVPSEPEVETLISSQAEAFVKASLESGGAQMSKSSRLVVAFFPTPTTQHRRPSSASSAATAMPAGQKSRPLAPTVTSALGWISASAAKALTGGGGEDWGAPGSGSGGGGGRTREPTPTEQEWQEFGKMWEAWVIDFDVTPDGRAGASEDRTRVQLNDFLLQSLAFVMERTTQVPPIVTADLQPFGMQASRVLVFGESFFCG